MNTERFGDHHLPASPGLARGYRFLEQLQRQAGHQFAPLGGEGLAPAVVAASPASASVRRIGVGCSIPFSSIHGHAPHWGSASFLPTFSSEISCLVGPPCTSRVSHLTIWISLEITR